MDDEFEAQFASCKVNWKIENFLFAHPLDDWSIISSNFMLNGLKSVRWRMSLELQKYKVIEAEETSKVGECSKAGESSKAEASDGLVSVYLEKLPNLQVNDAAIFPICVNWEMKLRAGNKVFDIRERSVEFGDDSKHGEIGIATTKAIFRHLDPFEPDKIVISLYFIAFDKNKVFESTDKLSRGIFLLSEDLKRLNEMKENYSDVILKAKDAKHGEYIQAHKAILSLNNRFSFYLNEALNDIIVIPNFDYRTLNSFIKYFYSGKVDYCIEEISISMIKCMEHFKCNALQPYYIPEEINMNSKIKVETHDYQWYVVDILDRDDFEIQSPPIRLHAGSIWHLNISLQSIDPQRFVSIFAYVTNNSNKPKHFSLEFALLNEADKIYFPRRLIKHIPEDSDVNNYESLGFHDFVRKREISARRFWANDDCVCVFCRVKTSDCSQERSIGCHSMCFVLSNELKSFKNFPEKMSELLERKLYCDITIKLERSKIIKAHICILVARSPGFQRRIESELSDNGTLIVRDMKFEVVKQSIRYMYKGCLDDQMISEIKDLHYNSSPDKLDIPSLHEESLKHMQASGMTLS